ncbi:uncharacterized protein LOC143236594 isoform X2 [Tachypleus tridentatus]|uniref:uncharacterized protein LOC143236594 isoform X2 n=1 Tax=Tachypleus tridentatus TaxID=6853 RepID=UPI003FD5BD07
MDFSRNLVYCILVLACFITAALSERNVQVCTEETESYGPIPPVVPESFEVKAEVVDHIINSGVWVEEYFDRPNLRVKLKTTFRGTESHFIYDYSTEQVVTYNIFHPGSRAKDDPLSLLTCSIYSMDSSPLTVYPGFHSGIYNTKDSRMVTSYEALHFGGPYKFAFNSSCSDGYDGRGIPVNRFRGCVYDKWMDSTFQSFYDWSDSNAIPPSGDIEVPIANKINGGFYIRSEQNQKMWIDKTITSNVAWFKGNPSFNDLDFQIPRRMYCENYNQGNAKKVPKFPNFFSVRVEITLGRFDIDDRLLATEYIWYDEVWYDYDQQLARVDFVPSLATLTLWGLFKENSMVSAILDFKSGLMYVTQKSTGLCVEKPISRDIFLVSSDPDTIKLASPEELFQLDSENLTYKGKYYARRIKCDVWSGKKTVPSENNTILQIYQEFYFSTEDWHSDSDEDELFQIPVRETQTMFQLDSENNIIEDFSELNFFKFKPRQPSLSVYDISSCAEKSHRKYFLMLFKRMYRQLIQDRKRDFVDAARYAIREFSKLGSVLRVQDFRVEFSENVGQVIASFMLIENQNTQNPDTDVSIAQAKENLEHAVNTEGSFVVILSDTESGDPQQPEIMIYAVKGSFQEVHPFRGQPQTLRDKEMHGNLKEMNNFSAVKRNIDEAHSFTKNPQKLKQDETRRPVKQMNNFLQLSEQAHADDNKSDKSGYSSGALAGLAIAMLLVGIGIGIALMCFYLQRYTGQDQNTFIPMMETINTK